MKVKVGFSPFQAAKFKLGIDEWEEVMSRKKLMELLQPKQRKEKKKINLYLSTEIWEEIEKYIKAYGYGKRKSEFVEKLLEYALDELRKLEKKKKTTKKEEIKEEIQGKLNDLFVK